MVGYEAKKNLKNLEFESPSERLSFIMETATRTFDVEGFDGGIESQRTGDHVEILYQSMPVMSFEIGNLTAKDWTIASLLETKLKGKTVAALCHTSPAQVSRVRKLVRDGGHEALIHGQPGRTKKLTGARLIRAINLRKKGSTYKQIGRALGVSTATAGRALAGIQRGRVKQQTLGGVGESPSPNVLSSPVEPPSLGAPNLVAAIVAVVENDSCNIELLNDITEQPVRQEDAEQSRRKEKPKELIPAMPLPPGPAEHPCRYAGTLLICAAVQMLGLFRALTMASVRRPKTSWYDAWQAVVALLSAWAGGFGSLEAMHERDASQKSSRKVYGRRSRPSGSSSASAQHSASRRQP